MTVGPAQCTELSILRPGSVNNLDTHYHFYQPNFHTVIECIPGCNIDSERAKHNPVKSGDYILEKFSRAYGKY